MQKYQQIILFILLLFSIGCHNASHLRTQKVLDEYETVVSIGSTLNVGGDIDANKYHSIKESNNFGGRSEISYLRGTGSSELGPYLGVGMTMMDFGVIAGFDYRTYSRLHSSNPLKVGGQVEINYTPVGETIGSTIVFRPTITTSTNNIRKYYYGIHGIIAEGMNLKQRVYYIGNNTNEEGGSVAKYDVRSIGFGISLGLETKVFRKFNIQVQLDLSNVTNNFKSSFLYPSNVLPDSGMMSNDYLEPGSLDYTNAYPFIGISMGTNFFKIKKPKKKGTSPYPIPQRKRKFDPKTGKEIQKTIDPKDIIYDPETGEKIN